MDGRTNRRNKAACFQISRRIVNGKRLLRFQSKSAVFKFLQVVWKFLKNLMRFRNKIAALKILRVVWKVKI